MTVVDTMKTMLDHRREVLETTIASGEAWRFLIKLPTGGIAYMMVCPEGVSPSETVALDFGGEQ